MSGDIMVQYERVDDGALGDLPRSDGEMIGLTEQEMRELVTLRDLQRRAEDPTRGLPGDTVDGPGFENGVPRNPDGEPIVLARAFRAALDLPNSGQSSRELNKLEAAGLVNTWKVGTGHSPIKERGARLTITGEKTAEEMAERLGPTRDEMTTAERLSLLEQRVERAQTDLATARSEIAQVAEMIEDITSIDTETLQELVTLVDLVDDVGGPEEFIEVLQSSQGTIEGDGDGAGDCTTAEQKRTRNMEFQPEEFDFN